MTKFEIGKTYTMRSAYDHECTWTYTVIARTEKTITLNCGRETQTCRISKGLSEYYGAEAVRPLGTYAACPTLKAQ